MASLLTPYLSFDGNARQALEFYKEVFGGELRLTTYGDFGRAGADNTDKIMHGMLASTAGFTFMGADMPPGMGYAPGNNFAVCVSGEDGSALRGYWEKLSGGGSVAVPLEKQMWGDVFGMCTDRFGVPWMVNINQPGG
ncbi:3-demethylubiquinone-9 3-methyltransferase [Streptomyces caelestis]|uniref:3-demethylubiquinone-9 3-methyltransferase n=1 Tax=Streptomyces caelestis TaxID=36816 RepID=A0A0M8QKX2_9ACTN|nr:MULTISPECIES: VOC family protein [Streptomyces]KOT40779.1 3-demethylubiquinone-9 3-methyltransferase [Streptomyces caelestis]KOV36372.1 3-demethylubiquinone-9 3-methyltransferase [Streptomyces sp. XY152]